ncbi:MAG: TIGR04211 family SH3 domain-containing protein [Methylococcales bacterium]|nr:TIGR04211 family SH3 domain-containing protein [Methylococcales bacterium]MDD5216070.1 TIGR04211 family SH3 domain-containing protein [Methylococcales bacterium]
MKKILLSALLLASSVAISAPNEVVYVADDYNLTLWSTSNYTGKIQILPTGSPLTIIGEHPTSNGLIKVKTIDGTEGFIKFKYVKKEAPEHDHDDIAAKNIAALQGQISKLEGELKAAKAVITPGTTLEQSLATERDKLSRELNELKKISGSAVQLKTERDELQERYVAVERDLQQVKLENQALQDTANQDWFLYGGMLALVGVLLGFILPKLSWKRSRGGWDTY